MPHIIGTAGHIDHGKTSLVKALTGEDTDRLKEEKARGISIELGFAHLDLPGGVRAGIVDVPGHERLIRTMLAGAHGMDLVLFAVAADDGIMPQTEEHLDILRLLGIEHAIFVVTKADLVSESRLAEVIDDVRVLIVDTAFADAPIVPFSSPTSRGLDELRARIGDTLAALDRPGARGYFFRLPVDRAFVLRGHGLVVTGTARAGEVHAGDRLRALPGASVFRVRSVQVHGQAVERGAGGQRVALNLSGQDGASIARGQTLCDERLTSSSDRFDAAVEVRSIGAAALEHHQRVRLHVGTAERMARLVLLGTRGPVASGQTAFCQIVLSDPVHVLRGDRFILRDETARRTLAGGVVLHPSPRIHRRSEPGLLDQLDRLRHGSLADVVEQFVAGHEAFAVTLAPIVEFANRPPADVAAALSESPPIRAISQDGEPVYTTEQKWRAATETLLASLRAFHADQPLAPGQEMEALRDRLAGSPTAHVFRAFVTALEADGIVVREGSTVRLKEHDAALRSEDRAVADRIVRLLQEQPLSPPDLPQLEAATGVDRSTLQGVVRALEREGAVLRVARDLYFLADSVALVKRVLREEFSDGRPVTPASFRDRFGTSRKYAIPLLEYLDRDGLTVRVGDARRLRSAASPNAGSGSRT